MTSKEALCDATALGRYLRSAPNEPLDHGADFPPQPAVSAEEYHWEWIYGERNVFEAEVWVLEEDEGFSAYSVHLPGVAASGDSPDEALSEIHISLRAAIASYLDRGLPIPWVEKPIETEGRIVTKRWLLVNA